MSKTELTLRSVARESDADVRRVPQMRHSRQQNISMPPPMLSFGQQHEQQVLDGRGDEEEEEEEEDDEEEGGVRGEDDGHQESMAQSTTNLQGTCHAMGPNGSRGDANHNNGGARGGGGGGMAAGGGGIGAGNTNGSGQVRKRGGTNADKEHKRLKRLLRNRVSAQQARERKKVYMSDLEVRSQELERRNAELEEKLSTLQRENFMLRQIVKNTAMRRGSVGEDQI